MRFSGWRWLSGVLFLALLSSGLWGAGSDTSETSYETDRLRLIEISQRLDLLNRKLQSELSASKKAYEATLTAMLASQTSLAEARESLRSYAERTSILESDLAALRLHSQQLSEQAAGSEAESTELLSSLKKAEDSLANLGQSLDGYQQEIARLVLLRNVLLVALPIVAIVAFVAGCFVP